MVSSPNSAPHSFQPNTHFADKPGKVNAAHQYGGGYKAAYQPEAHTQVLSQSYLLKAVLALSTAGIMH
jgi:hypothetical protein